MSVTALLQRRTSGSSIIRRALPPALFSTTLVLAAYLRLMGLTWGLNSGYGHQRNFQPDEFVSLRGVLQIDLLAGHFEAPGAYFEGTFNYYLWAIPQAVLKLAAGSTGHPADTANEADHSDLLYICRWISVVLDLCTIVVLFLAIVQATQRFYPAFMGALCYAILPMQVIYSHFMRTHLLGNLLCALVIWLSLKLRQSQPWQLLVTVGLLSGLGAAARYPVGLIAMIPCMYLLFNSAGDISLTPKARFLQRARTFISRQAWLIGLGFGTGLFFGHPMLFLDTSNVINAITHETLKYASLQQFGTSQLLNLSVVLRYIIYLIPFAMYPLLWLVPYSAILYLLFRPRLYSQSVPIILFSAFYLYFMAKGYLGPYFARATMLLFPGFCILVGFVLADLQLRLRRKWIFAVTATAALLVIFGLSVVFDVAYDHALQEKDTRESVRDDLKALIGDSAATIGLLRVGAYFYTVAPAVEPLKSERVSVQLQDADENADFLLVGFPRQPNSAWINATIKMVEDRKRFQLAKSYRVPVKIFGHEFSLAWFPPDMTYPFPTILLFRAKLPTSA
jgi:Dolichyl-phosphate-mannose-protein mannosyltransferase